jgi:hypothetical protein
VKFRAYSVVVEKIMVGKKLGQLLSCFCENPFEINGRHVREKLNFDVFTVEKKRTTITSLSCTISKRCF